MADFINYGDQQLEQQALLNNLANNVQNYVNTQPWSNKRKEKFMSAYSDIMNNGVLGASNSTGQWVLNTRNAIDLNSKDRKDREMYQEAAYFIQQQMAGLSSKVASEKEQEEKKKEELPTFNNEYFVNNITTRVSNLFGGQSDITQAWNELDKREENGLRGTSVRRERLAKVLQDYLDNFDETKVNFENSPFKDVNDFKTRMNTAISALKSGEDATDALNAIGLKRSQWLYDGSGDQYDIDADGNPISYGRYAELKAKQEQQKAQEEALLKQQKANAMRGILSQIGGIHAVEARNTPEAYQEYLTRYGTGQAGFNAINNRVSELINKGYDKQLTGADKKELGNLLYYIRSNNPNYKGLGDGTHTNVTDKEWADLRLHTNSLSSVNRGNFVRLPWQTHDGRYTYVDNKGNLYFLKPNNGQKFSAPAIRGKGYYDYKNNFLKGTSLMNKQQRDAYLKSKKDGLTSAEWEELASIGFDIASIVDPEMISAAGLALTGSGLRTHAMLQQPGGPSTSDWWWNAADWGLSVLGSIPVLGDSALAARAVNNLKKAIVPLGVVMAGANVPQAAKAAYNKVVNGQDLTIQDWRAIGGVLTAAVGMGRGRQMAKRAEALQRTGGTTSKSIKQGVIKTTEGEIKVSESKAKQLKEKFGENNGETRTKVLREDAEIQKAAREQGIDLSKAEVQGYNRFKSSPISTPTTSSTSSGNRIATLRAMSEFNKNHGWLARKGLAEQDWVFRKTGGYTSDPHRGLWQSIKNYFGKSEWDNFGQRQSTSQVTNNNNNQNNISPEILKGPYTPYSPMFNIRRPIKSTKPSYKNLDLNEIEEFKNFYLNGKQGKGYGNIDYSNPKSSIKEGKLELNFGGEKITFELKSNKNMDATKIKEFRRAVAKQIIPLMGKSFTSEQIKNLQKLKTKGWLKQGGKITDTQIDNFLKQYK